MRLYLITTFGRSFDCINRLFLDRVTTKVSSGFPMEYVETYEPRARFVHPHYGYDTLGPLGEITSKAVQHVTRSRDGISHYELSSDSR
jgi:hypothetical protein